ncbi:MAG: peptide-methionine (S)-S-oxide reductase MsrA [Verrucomicrobiota bacterium]
MNKLTQYFAIVLLLGFLNTSIQSKTESATFGAGCFWCVEAIYESYDGVIEAVSGYTGGSASNATYKKVSSKQTEHIEVVRVTFDPSKISYEKLLDLFWEIHDPTNPNGVWPDFGKPYRSSLFYENDSQKDIIEKSKQRLTASGVYKKPIATLIRPLEKFYPAEDYHQNFVKRNPNQRYVKNIALKKLKKHGSK